HAASTRLSFISLKLPVHLLFCFANETPPTESYTLSLHDALPISVRNAMDRTVLVKETKTLRRKITRTNDMIGDSQGIKHVKEIRSEEHTSELQSRENLVCRLLLEKKKKNQYHNIRKEDEMSVRLS